MVVEPSPVISPLTIERSPLRLKSPLSSVVPFTTKPLVTSRFPVAVMSCACKSPVTVTS